MRAGELRVTVDMQVVQPAAGEAAEDPPHVMVKLQVIGQAASAPSAAAPAARPSSAAPKSRAVVPSLPAGLVGGLGVASNTTRLGAWRLPQLSAMPGSQLGGGFGSSSSSISAAAARAAATASRANAEASQRKVNSSKRVAFRCEAELEAVRWFRRDDAPARVRHPRKVALSYVVGLGTRARACQQKFNVSRSSRLQHVVFRNLHCFIPKPNCTPPPNPAGPRRRHLLMPHTMRQSSPALHATEAAVPLVTLHGRST